MAGRPSGRALGPLYASRQGGVVVGEVLTEFVHDTKHDWIVHEAVRDDLLRLALAARTDGARHHSVGALGLLLMRPEADWLLGVAVRDAALELERVVVLYQTRVRLLGLFHLLARSPDVSIAADPRSWGRWCGCRRRCARRRRRRGRSGRRRTTSG